MVFKDVKVVMTQEKLNEILDKEIREITNKYEDTFKSISLGAFVVFVISNISLIVFKNWDMVLAGVLMYFVYLMIVWDKIKLPEYWHVKSVYDNKPENLTNVLTDNYEIFHLDEFKGKQLFELISLAERFENKTISILGEKIVFKDNIHNVTYKFKVDKFVTGENVTEYELLLTEEGLVAQVPRDYIISERETYSYEDNKMCKYNSIRKVKESTDRFNDKSNLYYCNIVLEDVRKEE